MMKRFLCLFLAVSMVFTMTGCIDGEELRDAIWEAIEEEIRAGADEVKDEIQDSIHQAGEDLKQGAEDAMNDAWESGKDALDDAKDSVNEALTPGQDPGQTEPVLQETIPGSSSPVQSPSESIPQSGQDSASRPTGNPDHQSLNPDHPSLNPDKPSDGSGPVLNAGEKEDSHFWQDTVDWVDDLGDAGKDSLNLSFSEKKCGKEYYHAAARYDADAVSVTCRCGKRTFNTVDTMISDYEKFAAISRAPIYKKEDTVDQTNYIAYVAKCYGLRKETVDLILSGCTTPDADAFTMEVLQNGWDTCSGMLGQFSDVDAGTWKKRAEKEHFRLKENKYYQAIQQTQTAVDQVNGVVNELNKFKQFKDLMNSDSPVPDRARTFDSLIDILTDFTDQVDIPVAGLYFSSCLGAVREGLQVVSKNTAKKDLNFRLHEAVCIDPRDIPYCDDPVLRDLAYDLDQYFTTKEIQYMSIESNWENGPSLQKLSQKNLHNTTLMVLAPYIRFRISYELRGNLNLDMDD